MANTSLYDLGNAGERVELEGILYFSALKNKAKPRRDQLYNNEPHYSVSIVDPKVVNGGDTELGKHILDDGITHGTYVAKSGKYAGKKVWNFDVSANSKYPVNIYTRKTKGDHIPAPELLTNELKPGQKVGILFSLYENKKYNKTSGSLDGVIIDDAENIQYLTGGGADYTDIMGESTGALAGFAKHNQAAGDEQASSNGNDEPNSDSNDDQKVADAAKDIFDD